MRFFGDFWDLLDFPLRFLYKRKGKSSKSQKFPIIFEIQLQDDHDLPKNHFFHPDFFSKAEPRCSSGHLKEQNLAERTWEPRLKKSFFFEQVRKIRGGASKSFSDT